MSTILPTITPLQSRILCMTSTLFYVPFLFTIYRRVVKQGYYGKGHTRIITVGQWLGVLSLITGTCSILYWQNQSHDSWRYYLDLTMAKTSGIAFFVCGYRYISGSYRRVLGYTLCGTTVGFYHLSNSWYLQGSPYWVICHGFMHLFTCCGQTYVIHTMVEPSADNTCMTDIENVDADTDMNDTICDKKTI
jgi:hypothetical protein